MPKKLWFILGHEPLLSLAELSAVIKETPVLLSKDIARVETTLIAKELILKLGGTVKIAEEIGYDFDEKELLSEIAKELDVVDGKIHFGLSLYAVPNGAKQAEIWGLTVKKLLKANGKSVRYVDNRGKAILSSVSVDKNGLAGRGREFIIMPDKNKYKLAKTLAVQPFESFSERDFGRPGRDDVSGMLPPKLAIMMINIADVSINKAVYDPSSGSGTILSEAALLGYKNLIGSDISAKAVEDTKKNIEWTVAKSGLEPISPVLFELDIQKNPAKDKFNQLGGIVTEPFLGPPLKGRESPEVLEKNAAELANLYVNSFKSFASFLPKGAKIVFVFPRFSERVRTARIAVPELVKLGFKVVPLLPPTISSEPFVLYQRENQHLGREIWKFTLC